MSNGSASRARHEARLGDIFRDDSTPIQAVVSAGCNMAEAAAITLARHFDSRAWQAAERIAGLPNSLYRQVQERRPALVKHWDPAATGAEIPESARKLCAGSARQLSRAQAVEAFCHAVAAGAHVVADELVDELLDEPRAIKALYAHWCALGELDRARAWHDRHAASFAYRHPLDPYQLAIDIDEGRLEADALSALLVQHRRELLRNPELHLLAHRALLSQAPEAARAALNRYLRAMKLPLIERAGSGKNYLRDMQLAPVPELVSGPRVSVLVAAYNAEQTIEYALASILGQSYQNLELLVCDDASTDGTLQLLLERFANQPRVRLFRSRSNQGSYNLRNALIAQAAGDLITVHDADDISLPDRIALQVAQLRNPAKKASVSNFLRISPEGRVPFFRDRKASRMAIVSLMASREVFAQLGPYRGARFAADFEFLERLKARYGVGAVARIRSPQLLCLWSERSVTRGAASEALANGYRSPARRAYSDLVYRERVLGTSLPVPASMREIMVPAAEIEPA